MDSTSTETKSNFMTATVDCTPLYLPSSTPRGVCDAIGTGIEYAPWAFMCAVTDTSVFPIEGRAPLAQPSAGSRNIEVHDQATGEAGNFQRFARGMEL
jgi:hypothetical protein